METEIWSVEVKPNERHTVTVDYYKSLHITKVAMRELKNEERVENLHVYFTRKYGEKVVLAILSSSESEQEAITKAVIDPRETVELSHGWKNGSIHFSGHLVDYPEFDETVFGEFDETVFGECQGKPKASLKGVTEEQEEGGSSKRKTEAGKVKFWSVDVGPKEALKVSLHDEFLHITKAAAMGDVKSGKLLEGFPVYLKSYEEKKVIGTLSSQCAPEAIPLIIFPYDTIELSHDWEDGSVRFSGHIRKCLGTDDLFETFRRDDGYCGGACQGKPKAFLKGLTEEEEEVTYLI